MPKNTWTILETFFLLLPVGFIWFLGGLANMLYKYINGESYSRRQRVANIMFSVVVTILVGMVVPPEFPTHFRDAALWVTGMATVPVYKFFQVYAVDFLKKVVERAEAKSRKPE